MIDSFDGAYGFLSNFHPTEVRFEGASYASVEHAYQAAKTKDKSVRQTIAEATTPGIAKRMGNKIPLRMDWSEVRVGVMRKLIHQKFSGKHPRLQKALLETGNEELVEGNWWNDTFWGVCAGKGENNLGKLLMERRAELREGK